jgi:hypothetical protein
MIISPLMALKKSKKEVHTIVCPDPPLLLGLKLGLY